jgi:hypothetical protein
MRTYTATVVRSLAVTAAAALMALVAAAPSGAAFGRHDQITFRRAVALPGVVLPAGAYIFEVANPESSRVVVRVANRDTKRVHFAGHTLTAPRPASLAAREAVTLGEAPRGEPIPVTGWYPTGRSMGYRFIW